MKHQIFQAGVEKDPSQWERPGKVEWPNLLTVEMSRRKALLCLHELSRQLMDDSITEVSLTFAGELRDLKD